MQLTITLADTDVNTLAEAVVKRLPEARIDYQHLLNELSGVVLESVTKTLAKPAPNADGWPKAIRLDCTGPLTYPSATDQLAETRNAH